MEIDSSDKLEPSKTSRRRFLSLLSASAALALGGGSCSRIDRGKVVPYSKKPQEIVPGIATYYASTFPEGLIAHGVLVKTREGRPIHVEGSDEHPRLRGEAPLRAAADLLGLYDPDRLRGPLVDGQPASWPDAMSRVVKGLKEAVDSGKPVLFLTGATLSPTRNALVEDVKRALPALRHASWEPAASEAAMVASKDTFDEWLLETHRFDRADVVVSLGCDFLGAEGGPEAIQGFAERRRLTSTRESLGRLWVLEGGMSLTGANADRRIAVPPSRLAALAFALSRALADAHGIALPEGVPMEALKGFDLGAIAAELGVGTDTLAELAADIAAAGRSALVLVGGALPREAHVAGHLLNAMLGAEGNTVDVALAPPPIALATHAEVRAAFEEAAQGKFAAAVFWDVNPAYAFPLKDAWRAAVPKIPLRVRIALQRDETANECQVVLPEHHWLESWGDHEPALDLTSLQQPAIGPLHDTRAGEDIILEILRGLGKQVPAEYLTYLKARWKRDLYPLAVGGLGSVPFERFWNAALHDGVLRTLTRRDATPRAARRVRAAAVEEAIRLAAAARPAAAGEFQLVLSPSPTLHDGRYANNGWLQELPDPVTKATWGNPAAVSVADAERLGVSDGDVLRIEAGGVAVEVPAIVQPGQAPGVVTLALGHGRQAGSVGGAIGENAFPLLGVEAVAAFLRTGVKVASTGGRRIVARTQEHHRMEGRDLVRCWTRDEYAARAAGAHGGEGRHTEQHVLPTLSPPLEFPEHKWGMAIDLSSCVGCSACVVACQSENNVPVVGPEQVARSREMHWIRIDRYYEGNPRDPRVVHQPVLCQQCDSAPCEAVCPVNATTHSPDGLNQMTYNRCVGTRYCANNCPYKVRRFNFFDYTSTKREPEILAMNPEVSVRPRGVMEKCTFCVQRIQDARQRAKAEGRAVRDGEIRPACAAACPARAIVFGDLKDRESAVSKLSRSDRGYRLLEELGARPSITYLARVTNPPGRSPPGAAAHQRGLEGDAPHEGRLEDTGSRGKTEPAGGREGSP